MDTITLKKVKKHQVGRKNLLEGHIGINILELIQLINIYEINVIISFQV